MIIAKETPFSRFFSSSISGSILLIVATVFAMIFANSELSEIYYSVCNQPISLSIGGYDLLASAGGSMTIAQFVNDALMAIFFFSVGLEIKREMLIGELSQVKHAMLPVIGALGGMVFPVLVFYFIAKGSAAEAGIAIPMATDIAFSLGVLNLLGKRVPLGLKVFLTALAVADDIGGILVIALFYSSEISLLYIFTSLLIMIALYLGARRGINSSGFYLSLGILMWFMFYHAGIHPTIAGVIVAFFVPARPKIDSYRFLARLKSNINRFPPITQQSKGVVILTHEQTAILNNINKASDKVISPLQKVEDVLQPIVTFAIIPLFAFVNAGVVLEGVTLNTILGSATLGVFLGLLLGKFLGIFLFVYASVKLKFVTLPENVSMKQIASVAVIGGIGFTVSLFIANLAYAGIEGIGGELLNQAKIGIILASIFAAVIGYFSLRSQLPKHSEIIPEFKQDEIEYSN